MTARRCHAAEMALAIVLPWIAACASGPATAADPVEAVGDAGAEGGSRPPRPGRDGGRPPRADAAGPGCSAATCVGCCDGNDCESGTTDSECGTGGAACESCDANQSCSSNTCSLDPSSLWDVVIDSATIPAYAYGGVGWDGDGSAPDPFVEIRIGSETAAAISTTWEADTITPSWGVRTTEGFRAALIQTVLRFDLWDADFSFHDAIGACTYTNLTDDVFDGSPQTMMCPVNDTAQTVGFSLEWRLIEHS